MNQVLFRNQADRWADEVVTTEDKAALAAYAAALDELDRLTSEVLAICATLAGQTIDRLMAKPKFRAPSALGGGGPAIMT